MVNFFRKRLLYKFEMPRHLLGYPDSSKGAQICCYSYQTGLDCFMEIQMHIYIYNGFLLDLSPRKVPSQTSGGIHQGSLFLGDLDGVLEKF